jgi:hypothetical protein
MLLERDAMQWLRCWAEEHPELQLEDGRDGDIIVCQSYDAARPLWRADNRLVGCADCSLVLQCDPDQRPGEHLCLWCAIAQLDHGRQKRSGLSSLARLC